MNKEKCFICKSHDIILIKEPEEMNRPCFICRSCDYMFTYGKNGGKYKDYVENRQLNKKEHENFIFDNVEQYDKFK